MPLPIIPKKSLGQNFLNSERVITKIVESAHFSGTETVLEIGPGLGAITKKLIPVAKRVVAVEKDHVLYETLSDLFHKEIKQGNLTLIQGDILNFDPEKFFKNTSYTITANIPYNITGLIIRKFLSSSHQPEKMILLIQKEVADRIVARDKKESLLSLSVKVYGDPKLITNVSRGNFNPPPRVDSAVISITNIQKKYFKNKQFEDLFFAIIHAGFAHKRKVLIKNLETAKIAPREKLQQIFNNRSLLETVRAEDLDLSDWIFITTMVYTNT